LEAEVEALKADHEATKTRLTALETPLPVDGVYGPWVLVSTGLWSACVDGQQSATATYEREVLVEPANGGIEQDTFKTETVTQACTVVPPTPPPPASGGDHTYFDSLVAHPAFYRGYSLREAWMLETVDNGGYSRTNKRPQAVTYDPANDPDPRRQDAAKVVITEAGNSLQNQVRVPIGTSDGHTYLITWDAWFGAEYAYATAGIPQQKTFQIASDGIWYEIKLWFGGGGGGLDPESLAWVRARGYNRTKIAGAGFGPNVTDDNPLSPMVEQFQLQPETWTRFWARVDQRANDWDLVSLWVADVNTDPVQVLDGRQMATALSGNIEEFYLEYNTSTGEVIPGRGDLVSYVRNIVILKDVADPVAVMQKPVVSVP
jgi:hypothetical protein